MIKSIRELFCKHSWQFLKEVEIYKNDSSLRPHKSYMVYICPKCLAKKKIKL